MSILTLAPTSIINSSPQHLIFWPLVERKKNPLFSLTFSFDLQPHHICNKGNPCKDWFYCVIEEHIGNLYCIGKQRKLGVENMNSVTLYMGTFNGNQYGWTGFCFIHFLIYAKKKLLGPRCIKIDMHVLSFGKPGFTYTLFW